MVFNSLSYFIFLPLIFLLFSIVSDRYRWLVLLLSSYVFYGFILKPVLLLALTAVILVTFRIGPLIDRSQDRSVRRMYLWAGVLVNLALLIYFKYLSFLAQNLNLLLKALGLGIVFDQPLPLVSIGLSFYIFQAISYLADIYFRMAKPEPHFGYFALYLAFFTKLLQGPIERAGDLIPQLKAKYKFNYDNMRFGMLLIAWGLFKKVVIADRLGLYVDAVYNDVHAFTGLSLLLATYSYAFQVFMDFSGYTDMALGSARLFNIKLTQNFNSPYLATSVTDFWRRWHISLSRWILDYIFEPLQMKFREWGKKGTALSLLVTFLACGIWHGASWCFIIWGILNGIYLAASTYYRPFQKKLHKSLGIEKTLLLRVWQIFVTFNLVSFALMFFRSQNVTDALYIITHLPSGTGSIHSLTSLKSVLKPFFMKFGKGDFILVTMASLFVIIINRFFCNISHDTSMLKTMPGYKRWCMYYLIAVGIIFFGLYNTPTNFIYLQF